MRGNFVDLPTDCPQRDERLGWTGDLEAFVPTAAFLYDTAGMLRSWLADLAVEQLEDLGGMVPLYVPWIPLLPFPVSAEAGWGDAAVVVPWTLYETHGDAQLLADQWPSMTAWLDAFTAAAGKQLDFAGVPFMLGDWLDPAAPPDQPGAARTPWPLVATAYLARSARIMARAAEVLGHDGGCVRRPRRAGRGALPRRVRDAERPARLPGADGVRAGARVRPAAARSSESTPVRCSPSRWRDDGWHIGTGFLGTPFVTDALVNAGAVASAYELLLQRENPSWLYPVTMGATTVWERWDSMLPDGSINPGEMTSFNHYAYGAVADWLHRTVAGLAPAAPGLPDAAGRTAARPRASPRPRPRTRRRTGRRRSPGRCRTARRSRLDVTVPPNSTAEVVAARRQRAVRGRFGPARLRADDRRAGTGREAAGCPTSRFRTERRRP